MRGATRNEGMAIARTCGCVQLAALASIIGGRLRLRAYDLLVPAHRDANRGNEEIGMKRRN